MVANLSLGFRRVLAAIMPGTAHPPMIPPETISGTIELPCSPNFLKTLSMRKAILAMYPESSSRAMKKNMKAISGTKPTTPPTPSMTPLTIIDLRKPAGRPLQAMLWSHSKKLSTHEMGVSLTLKVNWKRPKRTAAMTSTPRNLCVRTWSIRSDVWVLPESGSPMTCLTIPAAKPYLWSAITPSDSSSISLRTVSASSDASSSIPGASSPPSLRTLSSVCASCSSSFSESHLGGMEPLKRPVSDTSRSSLASALSHTSP